MPTFQILYFASASAYTGKQSESLPAPLPLSQLFPLLEERYPGILEKVLGSCSVSVGLEYVDLPEKSTEGYVDRVIGEGEEIAIIPPVSSG
jgi:molybdopterin synthase sulfur carrier subunit